MTAEHFRKTVEAITSHRPYKPFTIELRGGSRHEVSDAGAITVSKEGLATFTGTVTANFDHTSVVGINGCPDSDIPVIVKKSVEA